MTMQEICDLIKRGFEPFSDGKRIECRAWRPNMDPAIVRGLLNRLTIDPLIHDYLASLVRLSVNLRDAQGGGSCRFVVTDQSGATLMDEAQSADLKAACAIINRRFVNNRRFENIHAVFHESTTGEFVYYGSDKKRHTDALREHIAAWANFTPLRADECPDCPWDEAV